MSKLDWEKAKQRSRRPHLEPRRIFSPEELQERRDALVPADQETERTIRTKWSTTCFRCTGTILAGETCRYDWAMRRVRHFGCIKG